MESNKYSFIKKALLIVAIGFFLYNIYQTIITTIFVSHFPSIITQLPNFIVSSQPTLQLGLFLLQEVIGSIGIYLRLIAGFFAVYTAVQFIKKDQRYQGSFSKVLLFESLYFVLLIPAGMNHIVGSVISHSLFLNFYTGVSFLLQALLIFPPLFILSRKVKNFQNQPSVLKWGCIVASLYALGLWVKHGLIWVYALSPSGTQQPGVIDIIGLVNSLLTLLVAALVFITAWLNFRSKKKLDTLLLGGGLILIGVYFVNYALVSVWVPIYFAFLPLTEFWLITLVVLGIALLREPIN